jgi:hypothetical protein
MLTRRFLGLPLTLGLALGAASCAGPRDRAGARVSTRPAAVPAVANPGGTGPKSADVRSSDVDGNGVPEVYKYFDQVDDPDRPGEKKSALVREDLDVNWDGKIDIWRYFGADGQVVKEEWDADYDGNVDETRVFEAGAVARSERDRNNDGRVDIVRFYKAGKLERKETDTNGDGKADRWEYFTGRNVDRIGVDKDFDGTVDTWAKN